MTREPMVRLEYQIRLNVPAFVGGADQSSEWRVPPIKALLRQWWRVAIARELAYDWERVREREGGLFGHAWLDEGRGGAQARRSLVELSIDRWDPGTLRDWEKDPKVRHPEVGPGGDGIHVGSQLYLGYGPLQYVKGKGATGLKSPPALKPRESVTLTIRCPEGERGDVERALHLAHLFGSFGGRARNGWGSFELLRDDEPLPSLDSPGARELVKSVSRPWRDCLREEWAHAVGRDERGPLVWLTEPMRSYDQVMKRLAQVKIAFRTELEVGRNGGPPAERHLLGYPVTNHKVGPWPRQARLANQIRFKVAAVGDGLRGVVVHLPTRLPAPLRDRDNWADEAAPRVFASVHAKLEESGLSRWT